MSPKITPFIGVGTGGGQWGGCANPQILKIKIIIQKG